MLLGPCATDLTVNVRKATRLDIETWLRMRNALWPDSTLSNRQDIEDYFSGHSKTINTCFLIEVSGGPAGFIELNIRNYAEGSEKRRVPFVEGWYVVEESRGRGLGRLLMDTAEAWAREVGYTELASDTEMENAASIAAHRKLGFNETERIVCFLKRLD